MKNTGALKLLGKSGPAVFVIVALIFPLAAHPDSSKYEYMLNVRSGYESNIFHSTHDSLITSGWLNEFGGSTVWIKKNSPAFSQQVTGYFNLDIYPSYSRRNRNTLGLKSEPAWRYNKQGRFEFELDISRVKLDLIDDNGQVESRTYNRWRFDSKALHRYDFSKFRIIQGIEYSRQNYDEVAGLTSYDYHSFTPFLEFRVELTPTWTARAKYSGEKRNYNERKTFTVDSGSVAGAPSKIRNFWEHAFNLSLNHELLNKSSFGISAEYVKRIENFQNFFGFTSWQFQANLHLILTRQNRAKFLIKFVDKNYPNYWTSNVGANNRVRTDHLYYRFEDTHEIHPNIGIVVLFENNNKESNEQAYDYHNFTAGTGVNFNF